MGWNLDALTVLANSATVLGSLPASSKTLRDYICEASNNGIKKVQKYTKLGVTVERKEKVIKTLLMAFCFLDFLRTVEGNKRIVLTLRSRLIKHVKTYGPKKLNMPLL